MLKLMDRPRSVFCLFILLACFSLIGNHDSQSGSTSECGGCGLPACNALVGKFKGRLSFLADDIHAASQDFGNMNNAATNSIVSGVLFPGEVSDIVSLLRHAYTSGGDILVSARGSGHSTHGQALPVATAVDFDDRLKNNQQSMKEKKYGIVVEMRGLRGIEVFPGAHGEPAYVDVAAGELWVDVVRRCLAVGLAPRSFTDYLYLTVGGTLSNAGISGQTFRFGPQISNVLQLQVVTGKGKLVICSPHENADLFFAVLGGLGQFGIITRARIVLDKAPNKVRWIRVLYSDFASFSRDQELLIDQEKKSSFDYIEGFVIVNKAPYGLASVPFEGQSFNASLIPASAGPVFYCLEVIKKHSSMGTMEVFEKTVSALLAPLNHVPLLRFSSDVPYFDFLNRVHAAESNLRALGLWQTAHPWMNLFVPRSGISRFNEQVFKKLLKDGINGPIIVYPVDRSKWDLRMSAVIPDEDVIYVVGILRYALPKDNVDKLLVKNQEILRCCREAGIELKQYLPHYKTSDEWKLHFGNRWNTMARRKSIYDPLALLSTGQGIFTSVQ